MTSARLRLIAAAALFLGWLGWLGYAVWNKGTVQIVSRAQLTAATYLVVADVATGDDGQPLSTATVDTVLSCPDGNCPTGKIDVEKLPSAVTPIPAAGESRTPPAGKYLLPLVRTDHGTFRIAGLPSSPGFAASSPERARIYPWSEDVKQQLRQMGILKSIQEVRK